MLTDDEIEKALLASGFSMHKRKRQLKDLQPTYVSTLQNKAIGAIEHCCQNGVPGNVWEKVKSYTNLVSKFNLKPIEEIPIPLHSDTVTITFIFDEILYLRNFLKTTVQIRIF